MTRNLRWLGWLGLLGAVLVGVGETMIQHSPGADVTDSVTYAFFTDISKDRMLAGHFLAVLSAPLYVAGYLWLSSMLRLKAPVKAGLLLAFGIAAFVVGAAWIGQRAFIGTAVQAGADAGLIGDFSALHEPLGHMLRVLVLGVSTVWIAATLPGKSVFPRWTAAFAPIFTVLALFVLNAMGVGLGRELLPAAMNVAHILLFSVALWTTRG